VLELSRLLGRDRCLTGTAITQRATSYWKSEPMQARALLLPRSTDEVSQILRWCHTNAQSVVTHGGLTGCVGGTESTGDDIVLSLEKMNQVLDIDSVGSTATVEGGTILQKVQEAAIEQGLYFPLDLGARGSCTIGGNVATNAGGINVLRYGTMRSLVLGLEVVLADGTVVSSMSRVLKDNAGYDVKHLFVGSEGTLGVITRVVLRLFPQPDSRQTALVAAPSFDDVVSLLNRLKRKLVGSLSAFEVMWGDHFDAVTGDGGNSTPLERHYPFYVVLQAEGGEPLADAQRFEEVLGGALKSGFIIDAVIAKSEAESAAIWVIRENFESVLAPQPVYLYDVSLPIQEMAGYVELVKRAITERWPDGRCYVLGHMADGNLHLFVQPKEEGDSRVVSDEIVYTLLREIGGSISAEHGIGIEKLCWLPYSRSPEEIALMYTLKRSLDPENILNPGKVLGAVSQS